MRKNLIVGGAGFIGTALAKSLDEETVTVFDNFSSVCHSDFSIKEAVRSEVEVVVGDVTNKDSVTTLFEAGAPENVFYLAAETGTGRSLTNCGLNATVNTVGIANFLDIMAVLPTKPKYVALTSTRAVYGEGPYSNSDSKVVYPDQRGVSELEKFQFEFSDLHPLKVDGSVHQSNPCNVYGATKLSQEHLLRVWATSYEVPYSIVRYQNVYGAGQSLTNPYTGILIHFIKQILSKSTVEVYEQGGITRDFIHVLDAANLLKRCSEVKPMDAIFDCGSGVRVDLEQVAGTLCEIGNSRKPVRVNKYRLGDVRHACADITSARNIIDWAPTVDLTDGLNDLFKSAKERLV